MRAQRWMRGGAAAAGVTAASGLLIAFAGRRRWQGATGRLVAELERRARHPGPAVSFSALGPLPVPVQRYFRYVLRDGQPRIHSARVRQAGTFRTRERGSPHEGWVPFEAVQRFTADPPGFVWDARIRMAPLVPMRVRDGYVAGGASMLGAVAGLVPVVTAVDNAELRAGALLRYLAEAVWIPTALLPGAHVSWTPMDDTHARATIADCEVSASAEFEFTSGGEIVGVYSPARSRALPGKPGTYVPAPWGGRYGAYSAHGGMRVPTEAEVYWILEGAEQPYYRGRIVELEYDFAEPGEAR